MGGKHERWDAKACEYNDRTNLGDRIDVQLSNAYMLATLK